jgi:hypothetical protein
VSEVWICVGRVEDTRLRKVRRGRKVKRVKERWFEGARRPVLSSHLGRAVRAGRTGPNGVAARAQTPASVLRSFRLWLRPAIGKRKRRRQTLSRDPQRQARSGRTLSKLTDAFRILADAGQRGQGTHTSTTTIPTALPTHTCTFFLSRYFTSHIQDAGAGGSYEYVLFGRPHKLPQLTAKQTLEGAGSDNSAARPSSPTSQLQRQSQTLSGHV